MVDKKKQWLIDKETERKLKDSQMASEEHTGLSVSYYSVLITNPTAGCDSYNAECNDVIEALNMNYAEANVFKAVWRIAASRQGKKKKGNNTVYDAEKAVFFSERMLKQQQEYMASKGALNTMT